MSRGKVAETRTPPPSPSYRNRSETEFELAKSGSTDSAVEATEEVLENLEEKSISNADEEKENIPGNDVEEKSCRHVEPNCDNPCDSEKRKSDLSSPTPSPCTGDRRNLAEIKI